MNTLDTNTASQPTPVAHEAVEMPVRDTVITAPDPGSPEWHDKAKARGWDKPKVMSPEKKAEIKAIHDAKAVRAKIKASKKRGPSRISKARLAKIRAAQKLRWAKINSPGKAKTPPAAAQVPAIVVNTTLDLDGPATWDTVKYWADLAAKFQHASVAAQVMAGFGLLELRKEFGTNPGKRTDLAARCDTTSPHDAERLDQGISNSSSENDSLNWPARVEKFAGISDDTARRWMLMASGIKARWKKLAPQARLKELMTVPPSQWNEADTKLVTDSLHKVADGSTQIDFMRELGLAKEKSGGPGREPGCDGIKKKLTLSEEAALRQELAAKNWHGIDQGLAAYKDKFTCLTDADVTAQVARLEQALTARKDWLKQPLDARDPLAIERMFAL